VSEVANTSRNHISSLGLSPRLPPSSTCRRCRKRRRRQQQQQQQQQQLILLSYSANFFIYCAMSAQFRAALFDTFSRRRVNGFSTTTAGEAVTSRAGRRSTAATSMLAANLTAVNPVNLAPSTNDDQRRTGTRRRRQNWKTFPRLERRSDVKKRNEEFHEGFEDLERGPKVDRRTLKYR